MKIKEFFFHQIKINQNKAFTSFDMAGIFYRPKTQKERASESGVVVVMLWPVLKTIHVVPPLVITINACFLLQMFLPLKRFFKKLKPQRFNAGVSRIGL